MIKKSKFLKRNLLRRPYVVCSDRATLSCEVFSHKNLSRCYLANDVFPWLARIHRAGIVWPDISHSALRIIFVCAVM